MNTGAVAESLGTRTDPAARARLQAAVTFVPGRTP
jgi:hypothetical protein